MASPHPTISPKNTAPKSTALKNNETLYAIIASAVIAVILASLLTGSPFRAVRLGYLDYTGTPAAGAPAASATRAPANDAAPK